jgi:LuxR family maltose regulon positive regulatory protein
MLLKPEDLRFSPAEVEQFFDPANGVGITHEEMDVIYRRTEGWPAALQLFRLSLVSPEVRRSLGSLTDSQPSEVAEYLADNVLSLQKPGVQDFLLRTSLLTRLTAPLCNAVTGRRDSQEILLLLKRSGLFVRSLDSDTRWFEYHALFASFLREHLHKRSEAAALEVHRRAAEWHQAHGNLEETVHHAIACGRFALAADTLDAWASKLIAGAHLMTMERWCDRIPFEQIARRPSLLIKLAWALVFLRRREKLGPVLKLLAQRKPPFDVRKTTDPNIVLSMVAIAADDPARSFQVVDRVPVRQQGVDGFAAFELSAASNLMGYRQLAFGDFEGARECLGLARAHGERGDASFSRGYTIAVTGVSLLAQGSLREALDRFKAGMAEEHMHVDRSFASAALGSCYVWALYEANELDLAEALFGQQHDVIAESTLLDFLAVAYASMARIHDARGRPAKAAEILDEAEAIGHANYWSRYLRFLGWERIRRALLTGDVERAKAIAAKQPATAPSAHEWLMFSEDLEGEHLGRIRLAIHLEDYADAADRLATEFARQRGRVVRQIKLQLLDAQLQYGKGARNLAQRSLRKALQLAAPGGFVRCFLDEGDLLLKMVRDEHQSRAETAGRDGAPDHGLLEQRVQGSGADPASPAAKSDKAHPETLTDREKEILASLAAGVSNTEMAERLFVSENTVKFHLKNIYAKLAVSNRLQAITAARQLGLIR